MSAELFLVIAFVGAWSLFFGVVGLLLEMFVIKGDDE